MGVCLIVTPLGELRAEVITSDASQELLTISNQEIVREGKWKISGGDVHLRSLPINPKSAPKNRSVDAAYAILICIQAKSDTTESVVQLWVEVDSTLGGPSPGEHLEALTWSNSTTEVSLGTQDNEYLSLRAVHSLGLPSRFAGLWSNSNPVSYLETGLAFKVPSLATGEEAILCATVAWVSDLPRNADSSWFAVDIGWQELKRLLDTI